MHDPQDAVYYGGGIQNEDDFDNMTLDCPVLDDSEGMKRNLVALNLHVYDGSNDESVEARTCMTDPWNGNISCGGTTWTGNPHVGYSTMDMMASGMLPSSWTNSAYDPWAGYLWINLPDDDVGHSGVVMYYQAY